MKKLLKKIISASEKIFNSKAKNSSNKAVKKVAKKSYKKDFKKAPSKAKTQKAPTKGLFKPVAKVKIKVAKALPQTPVDVPEFEKLGLNKEILCAIADEKFLNPTQIQELAIPKVLEGSDIIGTAQTGTGKTAAFALPILQKLSKHHSIPRVLVLSPTRELAAQIYDSFEKFSTYTDINSILIQGGVSISRQIDQIKNGCDIIVATPGRLLDLISQKALSLKNIEILTLDEVDRMFDLGFIEDVSKIIRLCNKDRQTLFFSATMPEPLIRLSKWALKEPQRIEIGITHSPADTIEHYVYPVEAIQKYDLLIQLLKTVEFKSLIVFTKTKMDTDRISQWLIQHTYKVSTLHSDRSQKEREQALKDFKAEKTNILVATDIASRGLDIKGVTYVINYNVPEQAEDYVHRIGRTGRAMSEGTAITLFSPDEESFLKRIELFINAPIQRKKLDSFNYRFEPILVQKEKRARRRNH